MTNPKNYTRMNSIIVPTPSTAHNPAALFQLMTQTQRQALNHYQVAELLSQSAQHSVTYTPIREKPLIATRQSRGLPRQTIQYGTTFYRVVRNQATAAVTDGLRHAAGHLLFESPGV
jgi:hypothetical protein